MLALSWIEFKHKRRKEETANIRTHLLIFIKYTKKNYRKKTVKLQLRKIEENKVTVTTKRLLWEFDLCSKLQKYPLLFSTPATVFIIDAQSKTDVFKMFLW